MYHVKKNRTLFSILFCVILICSFAAGCADIAHLEPENKTEVTDSLQQVAESETEPDSSLSMPLKYDYLTGNPRQKEESTVQRPIAVMIGNTVSALPQSGLGSADVLYEMVTEGGITRLMAVYPSVESIGRVGPVRSMRDAFVQFLLPMQAVGVHIGNSIYGTEMLRQLQYDTVNGIYLGTQSFQFDEQRKKSRANEQCWYTDGPLIANGMLQNGLSDTITAKSTLFSFLQPEDPVRIPDERPADYISFAFSGVSDVSFRYIEERGVYEKNAFGTPHLDEATGKPLDFTNVFLLETDVTLKPDGSCTELALQYGEGWYFSHGGAERVIWKKGNPQEELRLYDQDGKECKVNIGKSYIGMIDRKASQSSLQITEEDLAQEEHTVQQTETAESVQSSEGSVPTA